MAFINMLRKKQRAGGVSSTQVFTCKLVEEDFLPWFKECVELTQGAIPDDEYTLAYASPDYYLKQRKLLFVDYENADIITWPTAIGGQSILLGVAGAAANLYATYIPPSGDNANGAMAVHYESTFTGQVNNEVNISGTINILLTMSAPGFPFPISILVDTPLAITGSGAVEVVTYPRETISLRTVNVVTPTSYSPTVTVTLKRLDTAATLTGTANITPNDKSDDYAFGYASKNSWVPANTTTSGVYQADYTDFFQGSLNTPFDVEITVTAI